jgi:hypothetical protein
MEEKYDIQSLGSGIINILEDNHLPSDDFNLEVRFSTATFNKISVRWTHYSEMKSDVPLQKINFTFLDDQIYALLKMYNFEITTYGLIIGIPYKIFDAYIEKFPEELSSPDVISKTGTQKGTISFYYALQRRIKLGINKTD